VDTITTATIDMAKKLKNLEQAVAYHGLLDTEFWALENAMMMK
jgi:hypothetical protein